MAFQPPTCAGRRIKRNRSQLSLHGFYHIHCPRHQRSGPCGSSCIYFRNMSAEGCPGGWIHHRPRSCRLQCYGGRIKGGYGAWTLCSNLLDANSTVFSFGIGNDLSFDIDVIQRHGASVVAWDPTINREQFERALLMTNPSASDRRRITFHPFGIAAGDDVLPFYRSLDPRSKSLSSTPNLRGYSTRAYLRAPVMRVETSQAIASAPHVDVLKLDVEGAEFHVFGSGSSEGIRAWLARSPPAQIVIEFHDRMREQGFEARSRDATREGVIRLLGQCGYSLVHESANREEVLFVHAVHDYALAASSCAADNDLPAGAIAARGLSGGLASKQRKVEGVRQVLAASGLSALEATASAWFEAQGIDSIDELREAETETELADALQLKPSRRKIFLKEVAKYNRTAAAAIMAARLVQDPPTLVRPARLRPATAAQAIDAATAVVSGPLLHFDMSRSSCVADERRLIKAGGKGKISRCSHCCFGFNHLSANLECELRWAAYARRQLVLNSACESGSHQGYNTGSGTRWTDYYDLSGHRTVSLSAALSAVSLDSLAQADQPSVCPRCVVLRTTGRRLLGSSREAGKSLASLLDAHRNASLIVVRTGATHPFCNHYQSCVAPELASVARSAPPLRFSRIVRSAGSAVLRSALVRGEQWTGVHARRGDKLRSDIAKWQGATHAHGSPSEVLKRLKPLLIGSSIFVASDERAAFFASWPGVWTASEHLKPRAGGAGKGSWLAHFRNRPFMAAALDMYLLTQSTRFIASFSSLFSRRVANMRDAIAVNAAAVSATAAKATPEATTASIGLGANEREEGEEEKVRAKKPASERVLFWINGSVSCPVQPHSTRADPPRDGWQYNSTMDLWSWEVAAFAGREHAIHNLAACSNQTMAALAATRSRSVNADSLRVIILTRDRVDGLRALLDSIEASQATPAAKADDTASRPPLDIELRIDSGGNMERAAEVLRLADERAAAGRIARVIRRRGPPLGLQGAWLGAWPEGPLPGQIGVILEDDITLAPPWRRWLEQAWSAYRNRSDIGAITLQRQRISAFTGADKPINTGGEPFLYKLVGSQGFSPHPDHWQPFLKWAYANRDNYNAAAISFLGRETALSGWFRKFGRSMWTQLFNKYLEKKGLFVLYPGLPDGVELAVHHKLTGEHFVCQNTGGCADKSARHAPADMAFSFPERLRRFDHDASEISDNVLGCKLGSGPHALEEPGCAIRRRDMAMCVRLEHHPNGPLWSRLHCADRLRLRRQASAAQVTDDVPAMLAAMTAAQEAALPDGFVIATFVNMGFVPLARNMLCSLARQRLDARTVVLTDTPNVCSHLAAARAAAQCVPLNRLTRVEKRATSFFEWEYRQLMVVRLRVYTELIRHGVSALFIDVDVVFADDIRPEIQRLTHLSPQIDLATAIDDPLPKTARGCPAKPAQPNAGIVLVRANERTRAFYNATLELLALGAAPGDGMDQGAFWGVIASRRFPITRTFFDCELVVNGRNYFAHPTIGAHAALVHANWMFGYREKVACFRHAGLWHVNESSASCTPPPRHEAASGGSGRIRHERGGFSSQLLATGQVTKCVAWRGRTQVGKLTSS